jgi:hypothetical protein
VIKRYSILTIRVTPEQREEFLKFADDIGETPSRLLRKLIRESINGETDLLHDEILLLKIGVRQLSGMRINLRQIKTAMNNGITSQIVKESSIDELIDFISSLLTEIITLIIKTNRRWVKGVSKKQLLRV